MPDYEINESPFDKRLDSIIEWKGLSLDFCKPFEAVLSRGREIERLGIKRKDSLHIASAIEMKCGYFITTDRRIFNKTIPDIETMNPREFVSKMEVRQ